MTDLYARRVIGYARLIPWIALVGTIGYCVKQESDKEKAACKARGGHLAVTGYTYQTVWISTGKTFTPVYSSYPITECLVP